MKPYAERLADAKAIHKAGLERVATLPPPEGQKFLPGAFVWIAKDLGGSMSHFQKDRPARVQYTYAHAYPWGTEERQQKEYSLLVRYDDGSWSSVAWYYESQLTEITDQVLIEKFKSEIAAQ